MPISRLLALVFLVFPAVAAAEPVRVSGSLVGMDRGSVAKARIELYPAWESYEEALRRLDSGKREPEPLASAVADEHGRFEITAPAGGAYRLTARREGHASVEIPLLPLTEDTDLSSIPLPKATPLEARVVGPDGRSAGGIEVRITYAEDRRFGPRNGREDPARWRIAYSAVSGKEGKLLLPGIDFGRLRLTVLSPGFLGQTADLGRTARQESPAVFSLKGRNVRIEVRGGEGRPVPRALVRWDGRPLAVTGPDGRLELAAPEGDSTVTVESREGWRAQVVVPVGASGIVPVRLKPPGKIGGKVVEADTGRPVAGALVWGGWPMAGPAVRSGEAGAFEVEAPPLPGSWVNATAVGYFPGERQLAAKGAATLKLEPAATLLGQVVDPEGRPVAGAWIAADPPQRRDGGSRQSTSRSQEDGGFRLQGLLYGGVYELTAVREGFARSKAPATVAPRGKPSSRVRIVLSEGHTATGRVVDAEGQPVEGAEVQLLDPKHDREESRATTGPDGRFDLRRLEPGRKMLRAGHPDHAPVFLPRIEIAKETPVFDLGTVTLPASGTIEGRVTDTRGRPLEGAEVRAFPAARERMPGWIFGGGERSGGVRTRPDGTFRIERLERGARFNVTAKHPGYVHADVPGVEAPTEEPIRIEMKAALTLAGQVVNPEGAPVPDAAVAQVEDSPLGGTSIDTAASTDSDGRFRVTGLSPGSLDLIVTADGYSARRLRAIPIPEAGKPEDLRIILERGSVLEAHVTDAEGLPVPDVYVQAKPEVWPDSAEIENRMFLHQFIHTDAEGRSRLQVPAPGTYEVSASHQHRSATVKVVAGPGVTPVELRLPPGVEISGLVLSREGAPAVGAYVLAVLQGERKKLSIQVQADGTFVIKEAPDGLYQLTARDREGRSSQPRDLPVAGHSVSGLELVIDQDSQLTTLSGRVTGLPPESLRGIQVEALPAQHPPYGGTTATGAGGEYQFDKLDPGEWTVTARSPHGQAQGTVRLDPGVPAVLDLEIAPGLTLSGRVLLDGAPLAGAQIRIWSQGEGGGVESTAYDGTFRIHGLRPGPQILVAADARGLGGSQTFELKESQELSFELSTGRLRGRIFAESGEPLEDTEVRIEGVVPGTELAFSTPGTRSGPDGSFEVRLGAGTYKVRVQKPGFVPFETTVGVPPGGEAPVEVPLKVRAEP